MEKFYIAVAAVVFVALFLAWLKSKKGKIDKDYATALAIIMPAVVRAVERFAAENVTDEQIMFKAKSLCHAMIPGNQAIEKDVCDDTLARLVVEAWHALKDSLEDQTE